ncbi:hypothetical protein GGI15_003326 [Coemansia interrupta]|uniref:Uncharacterized protein n=1 Tax=Coemansia interrupta TaxID=1126814 RepID=A0A9W8LJ51_9FUNG|nr:hypothetical protein GGI15_003326 [Coemansia interrupta]
MAFTKINRNVSLVLLLICLLGSVALALPADANDASANVYKREIDQETRDNYLKAIVIILGIMLGIQVVSIMIPIFTACCAGFIASIALALPTDANNLSTNIYKREIDQETRDNYLKAIVIILGLMLGIQGIKEDSLPFIIEIDALVAEAVARATATANQTVGQASQDAHMETSSDFDNAEAGEDERFTTYQELHPHVVKLLNDSFDTTPAMLRRATRDVPYYAHECLQPLETRIPFIEDNKNKTLTAGRLVTFATAQFDRFNKVTNACAHALTRSLGDCSKDETLENIAAAATISAASARHLQNDLLAIIGELAKLNASQLRLLLPHLGHNKQASVAKGFAEQWEAIKRSRPKGSPSLPGHQFQPRGGFRPPQRRFYNRYSNWSPHSGRRGYHNNNRGSYSGQSWRANGNNNSQSNNPNGGSSSNAGQQ